MTIKEVAKLAGVSPAAVSRYLNGGPVSEEKKDRIRETIEQTGYQPNTMARSMRTGHRNQIGIITPRIDSESAAEILNGVSERLKGDDYWITLGVSGEWGTEEVACIESLLLQQVAGIILMGTVMTPQLRQAIEESEKPIVITGQNFEGCTCVCHSDYEAARELMRRMLRNGRRKVGYISVFEADEAVGRARRRGAEAAWKETFGEESRMPVIVAEGFAPEYGCKAMEELKRQEPDLDGVICVSDQHAFGAMSAIHKAGKRIPEDIAVAGIGDSWADISTDPPLTSVRLPYRRCGWEAADLLLERIGNPDLTEPQLIRLGYDIVERESM